MPAFLKGKSVNNGPASSFSTSKFENKRQGNGRGICKKSTGFRSLDVSSFLAPWGFKQMQRSNGAA